MHKIIAKIFTEKLCKVIETIIIICLFVLLTTFVPFVAWSDEPIFMTKQVLQGQRF